MTDVERLEVLRRSPLFEMLSEAELRVLAELSRARAFAAGEVVFREGDAGDALFVLAHGEVEVLTRAQGGGERPLAALAPPEAFGEMSLIDREVRSATVRARTECVALQLGAENFTAFRKRSRDGFTLFLVNVARVLSSRLREANRRLAGRS
ncbi:MAG TPA: cyclic nucleotide-binding domain-containing protein [Anaeromyxobacter sp.]|nr:cyclic nucleotide-binding domain-containing protein [Anaeromyxobacter sp.]